MPTSSPVNNAYVAEYMFTMPVAETSPVQYLNNVINEGANYADAYFEIGYLKAFSSQPLLSATVSGTETILTTPTTDANGPASTTGTNTGTNSGTNTEDGASNDDSNAASSVNARNCIAAVAAMMVSACTWAML